VPGCRRGPREVSLTYFDRRQAVTVRYPAGWNTDSVSQEGNATYRFFSAPGEKGQATPTSASLLVAPHAGGLDLFAEPLLAGAKVDSREDVERQGLKGRAYRYARDAARYELVLLPGDGVVHGLFLQGDESGFKKHRRELDELTASFAVERPSTYPERKDERFAYRLRLPSTWKESRRLSSTTTNTSMVQFLGPAMGVEKDGSTVHAALTVTAEPLTGGSLDGFYAATRQKLGDAFSVNRHTPWRGGYLDHETIETTMAVSHAKRFYQASKDRGYTLVFEGREDVFHRVSPWCDLIAATFEVLPTEGVK
jgi:hypothetical protein